MGLRALFYFILCLILPIRQTVANAQFVSYPDTYDEARKQFLQSIWELKKQGIVFEHEELKISSKVHPELFVDAVYIPPLKIQKRLFILSTGIHGVEAPLGTALQVHFLRDLFSKLNRNEHGILLLHSLNPYGFFAGRRVTEANVDLNRNFLLSRDSFAKQSNTAYEEYKNVFSSEHKVLSSWIDRLRLSFSLIGAALRGATQRQKVTRAFAQGQYSDPKGIYFGGKEYEAQVAWIDKILTKKMRGYAELLHYDVHTGLGKASELQLISSLDTDMHSPLLNELSKSLDQAAGVRIVSPRSEGFYVTSGDFIDYVYAKAVKAGLSAAAFTAEFGTLGDDTASQLKTSMRIILENKAHHWGAASEAEKVTIKKDFQELFNPSDIVWRNRVLEIGSKALSATLKIGVNEETLDKAQ